MFNLNKDNRDSTARIISFVVLLGIIPAWFFYIGLRFSKTISTLADNKAKTENYLIIGQ
jgi:hypothetical protein